MNNIEKWSSDNQKITELFNVFNKNNIRWGIYAGAAVSLLTNNRRPTDIDILIHNDDFDKASNLIKDATVAFNMVGYIKTSDDNKLQYRCNNIEFCLDGKDVEVTSGLYEVIDKAGHELYLTDLAINNLINFKINKTIIYILNPFDTIAIKSIMQRGIEQNKFDLPDSQAIVANCNIIKDYVIDRSKEMSLTNREIIFLQKAGLDI